MIQIWGHRGHRHNRFPEKYPNAPHENSFAAFEDALTHFDGLETDIIASRQKTIYLMHDTLFSDRVYYEFNVHLDDASKKIVGDKKIYQMDDAEVAALKLKDGQELLTLEKLFQAMPRFPGRTLNLELKGPNTNDIAIAAVNRAVADKLITPEQIMFSCFNLPGLRDLRNKIGNQYKIAALFAMIDQTKTAIFPDWPDAPQDAFYTPFKLDEHIMQNNDVIAINPDYYNIEYRTLTDDGVKAIHDFNPNAKIILWPAGEPHFDDGSYVMDIIKHFAPTGKIHAVMSDFPEILKQKMQECGLAA